MSWKINMFHFHHIGLHVYCFYIYRLDNSVYVPPIPVVPHKAAAEVSKIGNL